MRPLPIHFTCKHCDRVYDLPEEAAGRKGKCECGAMLVIPSTPAPSPPTEPEAQPEPEPKAEPGPNPDPDFESVESGPSSIDMEVVPEHSPLKQAPSEPTPRPANEPPPLPAGGFATAAAASAPATTPTTDQLPQRYGKLRKYCRMLSFFGDVVHVLAILGALLNLLAGVLAYSVSSSLPTIEGMPSAAPPGLGVVQVLFSLFLAGLVYAAGYGLSLLLKATAQVLHAVVDIEENTRATAINSRPPK